MLEIRLADLPDFADSSESGCEKKNRGKKVSNNDKVRSRLHRVCEQAKRTLSSSTTAMIEVDCLFEGIDFSLTLSRARFEELCGEIFRKTMEPVNTALKDAKLGKIKLMRLFW